MPKIIITEDNITDILGLIDTWEGKLTWPLLCKKTAVSVGVGSVERQSLAIYPEIQRAFSKRKEELREARNNPQKVSDDVTVEYLKKQVARLEADNARLKEANERYKQRFILWQYNAYTNGVRVSSLDDVARVLDKPLHQLKRSEGG